MTVPKTSTKPRSRKKPDGEKPVATDWLTLLAKVPKDELDAEFVRRYGLPSPFGRRPGKPWTLADWID